MKLIDLTLYENIRFHVMKNQANFNTNMAGKSYMKRVMDFVEGLQPSPTHLAGQHSHCNWRFTNLTCKHKHPQAVSCPLVLLDCVIQDRFVGIGEVC